MRKIVAFFTFLCILQAAPVWADKEDLKNGFMGIAWGSAASDLPGALQVATLLADGNPTAFSSRVASIGGLKVNEIQFFYCNNKFGQAVILHDDMEQLTQALIAVYGPPDIRHDDGIINWRVDISPDSNEVATIGIIPQRQAAVVVNSNYLTQMLEEVTGK